MFIVALHQGSLSSLHSHNVTLFYTVPSEVHEFRGLCHPLQHSIWHVTSYSPRMSGMFSKAVVQAVMILGQIHKI